MRDYLDPLAPPRRLSRVIIVGSVLALTAAVIGGGYYLHLKQKARVLAPRPERAEPDYNGSKKFERAKYTPMPATTNGVDVPKVFTPPAPPKPLPAQPKPPTPVVAKKRHPLIYVVNKDKIPPAATVALYTLRAWDTIPCLLEFELNSEIPGMFVVRTKRPVFDATGQHVLIPQGYRIGAKAVTGHLLVGHERIPTFALSLTLPDGRVQELGEAPILDAAGTNGLTGDVDNHIWRLVWTSIFIEGLRAGQQVLTQEIASQHEGYTVTGVGQYSANLAQQRLGRAQDTRPTIRAHAGEGCHVLIPKPLQLPALGL